MWVPMLVCIYSMYSLILWKFYKFQGRRKPLNCGCAVHLVDQNFQEKTWVLAKEGAKKWVCSCTPCTPSSLDPVLHPQNMF